MDNNSASTEFKQLIAKGKDQGYLTIDEINDLIKNNEFVQPIHLMGWLMVKKGVLQGYKGDL